MKVTVKWSGQSFQVECDLDSSPSVFFSAVQSATSVPVDRQKLMFKGKILKDTWDGFKVNGKSSFLLMGHKGELVTAPPPSSTSHSMDQSDDNQVSDIVKKLVVPIGINNLGNTCYLNSTVQCLMTIKELSDMLKKESHSTPLIKGLATLANTAQDVEHASVDPLMFVVTLRSAYPQFAEADNHGFKQQDAEEAWAALLNILQTSPATEKIAKKYTSIEMMSEITCDEAPQEEKGVNIETYNKLNVHIGAGVSTHMVTDIKSSLEEKIEKTSSTLNRMANYTKKSLIQRLPKYLTMHFIRFQWKPSEKIKAKILKNVKFPLDLDATQFCTPELKSKCENAKSHITKYEDAVNILKKRNKPVPASERPEKEIIEAIGVDPTLVNDEGVNVSGLYELAAVLTHIGRTADSGHYIAWVRHPDSDVWWKCDDDKISPCSEEDILKLGGGGDWHSAYICLYRAKSLKDIPDPEK